MILVRDINVIAPEQIDKSTCSAIHKIKTTVLKLYSLQSILATYEFERSRKQPVYGLDIPT